MIKVALLECKSGTIALVWFPYSLHTYSLNHIINCASIHYGYTLKTQEFRTKDFVVRRGHSIEHQKCKYSLSKTYCFSVFCHNSPPRKNNTFLFWKVRIFYK